MTGITEERLRSEDLAPALGIPEVSEAVLDRLASEGHARNGFCEACWAASGGTAQTYVDLIVATNVAADQKENLP